MKKIPNSLLFSVIILLLVLTIGLFSNTSLVNKTKGLASSIIAFSNPGCTVGFSTINDPYFQQVKCWAQCRGNIPSDAITHSKLGGYYSQDPNYFNNGSSNWTYKEVDDDYKVMLSEVDNELNGCEFTCPIGEVWGSNSCVDRDLVSSVAIYDPIKETVFNYGAKLSALISDSAKDPVVDYNAQLSALITTSPTKIILGQKTMVSWESDGATDCYSDEELWMNDETSGSVTVSPKVTTTYHLECINRYGSVKDSVTVVVDSNVSNIIPNTPLPTADIIASKNSIYQGESTTLTWSSTDATTCTSDNFNTRGTAGGAIVVSPIQTTTYQINCTNESGSAGKSIIVNVQANDSDLFLIQNKEAIDLFLEDVPDTYSYRQQASETEKTTDMYAYSDVYGWLYIDLVSPNYGFDNKTSQWIWFDKGLKNWVYLFSSKKWEDRTVNVSVVDNPVLDVKSRAGDPILTNFSDSKFYENIYINDRACSVYTSIQKDSINDFTNENFNEVYNKYYRETNFTIACEGDISDELSLYQAFLYNYAPLILSRKDLVDLNSITMQTNNTTGYGVKDSSSLNDLTNKFIKYQLFIYYDGFSDLFSDKSQIRLLGVPIDIEYFMPEGFSDEGNRITIDLEQQDFDYDPTNYHWTKVWGDCAPTSIDFELQWDQYNFQTGKVPDRKVQSLEPISHYFCQDSTTGEMVTSEYCSQTNTVAIYNQKPNCSPEAPNLISAIGSGNKVRDGQISWSCSNYQTSLGNSSGWAPYCYAGTDRGYCASTDYHTVTPEWSYYKTNDSYAKYDKKELFGTANDARRFMLSAAKDHCSALGASDVVTIPYIGSNPLGDDGYVKGAKLGYKELNGQLGNQAMNGSSVVTVSDASNIKYRFNCVFDDIYDGVYYGYVQPESLKSEFISIDPDKQIPNDFIIDYCSLGGGYSPLSTKGRGNSNPYCRGGSISDIGPQNSCGYVSNTPFMSVEEYDQLWNDTYVLELYSANRDQKILQMLNFYTDMLVDPLYDWFTDGSAENYISLINNELDNYQERFDSVEEYQLYKSVINEENISTLESGIEIFNNMSRQSFREMFTPSASMFNSFLLGGGFVYSSGDIFGTNSVEEYDLSEGLFGVKPELDYSTLLTGSNFDSHYDNYLEKEIGFLSSVSDPKIPNAEKNTELYLDSKRINREKTNFYIDFLTLRQFNTDLSSTVSLIKDYIGSPNIKTIELINSDISKINDSLVIKQKDKDGYLELFNIKKGPNNIITVPFVEYVGEIIDNNKLVFWTSLFDGDKNTKSPDSGRMDIENISYYRQYPMIQSVSPKPVYNPIIPNIPTGFKGTCTLGQSSC